MEYGREIVLDLPYPEAVDRVRQALAAQGFGVLTEIDVRATLKAKLAQDLEDYVILGACNPQLAHQALDIDRHLGLLLPCNVVVRAQGAGTGTVVEALDPRVMVTVTGQDGLAPIAEEAGARLDAALAALAAGAAADR